MALCIWCTNLCAVSESTRLCAKWEPGKIRAYNGNQESVKGDVWQLCHKPWTWIYSVYSGSTVHQLLSLPLSLFHSLCTEVAVLGLPSGSLIFCQQYKGWRPIRPGPDRQTDVHTHSHKARPFDVPPHASKSTLVVKLEIFWDAYPVLHQTRQKRAWSI